MTGNTCTHHESWTGDEGPIDVGPVVRWRCDACDAKVYDDSALAELRGWLDQWHEREADLLADLNRLRAEVTTSLTDHIEAARIAAFSEVLQAVDNGYRKAWAELETACANNPGDGLNRDTRRAFNRVDAWCDAVHLVRKIRDEAIANVRSAAPFDDSEGAL